jgi:hypothetical protein
MTNRFYSVDNKLITNKLIKEYFNSFWFEISRDFKEDSYLSVILKIQFTCFADKMKILILYLI